MFNIVCDRERLICLIDILNPCLNAIMELFHHGDELPWAVVFGHDPPQALTTDSVEGLGQIDVGGKQVGISFLTFLWKLPCSKHHAYGYLVDVQCETVEQDLGVYLVCDGDE